MGFALDALCRGDSNNLKIICVYDAGKLEEEIDKEETKCVVLDIDAHNHAYWLYRLRARFPDVSIIITQRRILFSDRVLAE